MKHTFFKLMLPLLVAFSSLSAGPLDPAPGELLPQNTTFEVSKAIVVADNVDTALVSVKFLDINNVPVTNILETGTIRLIQNVDGLTAESTISIVDSSQSSEGIYSFEVSSSVAETVNYSVYAEAEDVFGDLHYVEVGSVAVQFVSGALDLSKSILEVSSSSVSTDELITVNLYLNDAQGNGIKDFELSRLGLSGTGDDDGTTKVLPLSFDEYPQWETLSSNVSISDISHDAGTNKYTWTVRDTRVENVYLVASIDGLNSYNTTVHYSVGAVDKNKTYSAVFTSDASAPYGIGHIIRKLSYGNYKLYAFVYDSYYNPVSIESGLDIYSLVSQDNLNNTHTFGIYNTGTLSYSYKDAGIYSKYIKAELEDGQHYFFTVVQNKQDQVSIIEQ